MTAARAPLPVVALLLLWLAGCVAAGDASGARTWEYGPSTPNAGTVSLTAQTNIHDQPDWQANMLIGSAEALNAAGGNVSLVVSGEPLESLAYHDQIIATAARGQAPDIVYIDHLDRTLRMAEAGYLWPLDECRRAQPGLAAIPDGAWQMTTHQDNSWFVPNSLNVFVLFYNKALLSELGWPAERIGALPDDVRAGRFTVDDLITTAAAAIDAGVVEPGYGYWQYLGNRLHLYYAAMGGQLYDTQGETLVLEQAKLTDTYRFVERLAAEQISLLFTLDSTGNTWSGRIAWHDAILDDRVLFWLVRSAEWTRWSNGVADPAGLRDRFGAALFPSAVPGQPGVVYANWSGFVVMSPQATGRENQAAACALLAHTTAPDNAAYAMTMNRFPVITAEIPADERLALTFTVDSQYITDYALDYAPPNDLPVNDYIILLAQISDRVLAGELTAEQAVEAAVEEVRATFGDAVIIK